MPRRVAGEHVVRAQRSDECRLHLAFPAIGPYTHDGERLVAARGARALLLDAPLEVVVVADASRPGGLFGAGWSETVTAPSSTSFPHAEVHGLLSRDRKAVHA